MLLTERPRGAAPGTTPAGDVRLRLRGEGGWEQVVGLPLGKSTVGASPRCTLQIDRPGVAPVHCLIVHDGDGLTVRRWASDALLNGLPFDDATLSAGDRLSLGPVELEVLAGEPADPGLDEPTTVEDLADGPVADHVEDQSAAADQFRHADAGPAALGSDAWQEAAAEAVFQRLRTARSLSRTRSRKLLAALRRQRDAYREVVQRVTHLEHEVHAGLAEGHDLRHELERARCELAAAEDRLGEIDSLAAEKDRLATDHARLANDHERLSAENAALEEAVEVARRQRQEAVDKLEQFQQQVQQRGTESDSDRERLLAENAALEEAAEDARCQRQEAVDALEQFQQQVQQREAESDPDRERLLAEKSALEEAVEEARRQRQDAVDALEQFHEQAQQREAEADSNRERLSAEKAALEEAVEEARRQRQEAVDALEQFQQQVQQREAESSSDHERLLSEKAALEEAVEEARRQRQQAVDTLEQSHEQAQQREADFDRERADWDERRQDWQSRLADHVRQIEDFQRQLESLREDGRVQAGDEVEPPADPSESSEQAASAPAADEPNESHESQSEPEAADAWGPWHETDAAAPSAGQQPEWPASDQPAEDDVAPGAASPPDLADSWDSAEWSLVASGSINSEDRSAAPSPPDDTSDSTGESVGQPAQARDWLGEETTGSNLRDSDLAALQEFSLRDPADQPEEDVETYGEDEAGENAAPASEATPVVQHHDEPADTQAPAASPDQAAPGGSQDVSYIERYAHLFEDIPAGGEPVPAADPPVAAESGLESQPSGSVPAAHAGDGDEESIEQYMAKLMQRTRGQSSAGPPASTSAAPQSAAGPGQAESAAGTGDASDAQPLRLEDVKHKGRRPEPSSNLAALRSLANDIARQAIGTYAARRYRRTALTQIIIATLAAMTSLYLILHSVGWWDVRFISACVSLAAALYWGLLTINTLIDSVRASVFEELENDLTDVDPWHPPLPIDVEHEDPS